MEKLNKEQLEEFASSIINKELEENNLDITFYPLTYITYAANVDGNLKSKIKSYKLVKGVKGFHDRRSNTIIVFLDDIMKMPYEDQLFSLAYRCFHEFRHAIQKSFPEDSYDRFVNDINRYHQEYLDVEDYNNYHDFYSYEIGADMYAVSKTKELLKKNYPEVYEANEKKLNALERRNELRYMSYPYFYMLNTAMDQIMRKKNFNEIAVLKYFVDEYGNFKSIHEIKESEEISKLNKRIVYDIMFSSAFKKSINQSQLSKSDIEFLNDVSEYAEGVHENQINFNKIGK